MTNANEKEGRKTHHGFQTVITHCSLGHPGLVLNAVEPKAPILPLAKSLTSLLLEFVNGCGGGDLQSLHLLELLAVDDFHALHLHQEFPVSEKTVVGQQKCGK